MKRRLWPLALGFGYIAMIYVLGGLKARHVMMGMLCLLDAHNERTRSFLKYFLPFMLTGIVYDFMRYFYWWGVEGHIHVVEPYNLEKKLFGIQVGSELLTPNEYFERFNWKIVDFFTGFAYLTFVLEYLSAAFLLFAARRYTMLRAFGWCFFLMNVMGFATYYIYPAAPPWYITKYGMGPAQMYIPGSTGAAYRFDAIFGTHFFDAMYAQSVDIYGAIPSLHVAYPLLVAWVTLVTRRFRPIGIGFYFLMCFSAVYLQHHYIIDIILGTLYAVAALMIVRYVQDREKLTVVPWRTRLERMFSPTENPADAR